MKVRQTITTNFDDIKQLSKDEYARIRHRENAKFSRLKPKQARKTYTYAYAFRKQLLSRRDLTFPPYDIALSIVSRIPSIVNRSSFDKWYKDNRITHLPANPDDYYATEWQGWSVWCNSKNKEEIDQPVPMLDAMKWVHKLRLPNKSAWVTFCKENKLPPGIPLNPHHVYSDWKGWIPWLGEGALQNSNSPNQSQKTLVADAKEDVQKNEQTQEFIFIVWEIGDPNVVFNQITFHNHLDAVALFNKAKQPNAPFRLLATVDISQSSNKQHYERIIEANSIRHPTVLTKRKALNWYSLKQQLDHYVEKFELKINTIKQ